MINTIRTFGTLLLMMLCFDQTKAQTVTDIDNNVYSTISIHGQIWMKENLRVTRFNNGDPIGWVKDSTVWRANTNAARCYFANDSIKYAAVYGALYNWYAASDSRKICPEGWHVSTGSDWNKMLIKLDPTVDTTAFAIFSGTDIGYQLREAGTSHWKSPNEGATNSSGFTGLPGGFRTYFDTEGSFLSMGTAGIWFSLDEQSGGSIMYRGLSFSQKGVLRYAGDKKDGYSVRCIKDGTPGGVQEKAGSKFFKIYPNPANTHLIIESIQNLPFRATLTDLQGKEIISQFSNIIEDKIRWETTDLMAGFYQVKLMTDKETLNQMIFIQH